MGPSSTIEKAKEEGPMAREEKLLTPRDVANILGCSPDHVIRLARTGEIRVAGPGRFWRFRYADVMVYREQAAVGGSSEK
jgi:excisionase family DNA binding protein